MKSTEIINLLPSVFQRTLSPESPLAAILEVMEVLHAPAEDALATLPADFDPLRAPEAFVPFLGRWVGLARLYERDGAITVPGAPPRSIASGMGRLREVVAHAAELATWAGTARGLLLFLTLATGLDGFTIDEGVTGEKNEPREFHFRVHAPRAAEPYIGLLRAIIELEKPAYATYELILI